MFFYSIKDTQVCSRSIEATPDAVVAITTGKMLQTSLSEIYSKKVPGQEEIFIIIVIIIFAANCPDVAFARLSITSRRLDSSLRGGTASVTLALERKSF